MEIEGINLDRESLQSTGGLTSTSSTRATHTYCDVPGSPCLSKTGPVYILFFFFFSFWVEPGWFVGDPTPLARDNIFILKLILVEKEVSQMSDLKYCVDLLKTLCNILLQHMWARREFRMADRR